MELALWLHPILMDNVTKCHSCFANLADTIDGAKYELINVPIEK